MRRTDREVTDSREIERILAESKYIHIGMNDDGRLMVLPMNYGYLYEGEQLYLYMHGALEGHKYEVIGNNPFVAFEMECSLEPIEAEEACQYSLYYASVMGNGKAEVLTGPDEKIKGLKALMKTQTGKDFDFTPEMAKSVAVIRITVDMESITAKSKPLPVRG